MSHPPRAAITPDAFIVQMSYFKWTETGLTDDCQTLEAMASRFEESAKLMRRMAQEGFKLDKREKLQLITHHDPKIFESWGFINEEPPFRQLTLIGNQ